MNVFYLVLNIMTQPTVDFHNTLGGVGWGEEGIPYAGGGVGGGGVCMCFAFAYQCFFVECRALRRRIGNLKFR